MRLSVEPVSGASSKIGHKIGLIVDLGIAWTL